MSAHSARVLKALSLSCVLILAALTGTLANAALLDKGRVAFSSDGNIHDPDDIVATAISVAMLAKAGRQSQLVYYGYSDHIWAPHDDFQWSVLQENLRKMRVASEGTAEEWGGFDLGVFYQAYDEGWQPTNNNYASLGSQTQKAVNALRDEINQSSANDPLTIIMAGPAEVVFHAVDRSNTAARKHVTVVSHSEWNNWHGNTEHGGHSYNDIIALGVTRAQIADQNNHDDSSKGLKQDPWRFHWMRDSGDSRVRSLWQRHLDSGLESCCGFFDGSDAGMTWYALFGESFHTKSANVLRDFFAGSDVGSDPTPTPDPKPPVDSALDAGEYRIADSWKGFYANVSENQPWISVQGNTLNDAWGSMKWNVEPVSGNIVRLRNSWTGLYLNALDDKEWSETVQAPLEASWGSMQWAIEAVDNGRYRLRNVWSNMYLSSREFANEPLLLAELRSDWGSQIFTVASTGNVSTPPASAAKVAQGSNGKIIIEAESTNLAGDWRVESAKSGYTGSGYITFRPDDSAETIFAAGTDTISYLFKPDQSGRYLVEAKVTKVGTDDKHNDSWIRVANADAVYSETAFWESNSKTLPLAKNAWQKLARGGSLGANFAWTPGLDIPGEDHNTHKFLWLDLTAGNEYKLEISGRSTQFSYDRFHIYKLDDPANAWQASSEEPAASQLR